MPIEFADKILSGFSQGTPNPGVYQVLIEGRARGITGPLRVVAQTPEQIGIQIDNDWEPLVANGEIPVPGFGGGTLEVLSRGIGAAATSSGISRSNQFLTSQVWRGTSPLEIQLPLLLNATRDAFREVVEPIRNLIQLASPYRIDFDDAVFDESVEGSDFVENINRSFGNIIHAPGPTLLDVYQGRTGNNVRLAIGRIMDFPSVVLTGIQIDIPNRFTRQGYPIEADVNVTLRTHQTYLREDYQRIFGGR